MSKLLAQHPIDARDHVAHDLARRVPDAKLLAEIRVEGFEERFVEILDGVMVLERGEECGAVHPIENCSGPVEHLGQLEAGERSGIAGLMK